LHEDVSDRNMSEVSFDVTELTRERDLVSVVVPRERLFGLLRRTVRVPAGWSALVIGPENEQGVVPPGGELSAAEIAEAVFVRIGPLTLSFREDGVPSADEYLCQASLQLDLELSDQAADLAAFRTAVMGWAERAALDTLQQYLKRDVRRGLAACAQQHNAADLVDGRATDECAASIRQAIDPACFAAGIRVVGVTDVGFLSSALELVRQEVERGAVQRDRIALNAELREAADAAHRKHLDRVEQTLRRLQEMAEASPGVSVGELIRAFGQEQRGELYRGLARAARAPQRCQAVVVAVGGELVWLDPSSPSEPVRRRSPEVPGGAVRSVRFLLDAGGCGILAAGGSSCVVLMDPAEGSVRTLLSWDLPADRQVRGGVNSVAISGTSLLATHSELGIGLWSTGAPGKFAALLPDLTRRARAVRHLQTDARGRIWLSIDQNVICLAGGAVAAASPMLFPGSETAITSLASTADGTRVYAGNEAGHVICWETDCPESCKTVYSGGGGPCRSVSPSELLGLSRLGLTDDGMAVKELILDDTVVEQYLAGGQRLRQAWWSDELIVATDDHRSRLFFWRIGEPDRPYATTDIGWICSNRIQDACMLTTIGNAGEVGPVRT
jgi:hypothetical protein